MNGESCRKPITPDTKIGDLLADHPEIEDLLIEISPTFQALRNPVLRRTVAKFATIRQVAQVGGIPLGSLIGRLRCAVGQEAIGVEDEGSAATTGVPDWARTGEIVQSFDAREVIESGGHPMERVMRDLLTLEAGKIYELITPFVPAPLVDLARQKGFEGCSFEEAPAVVRTRFRRE